MSLLSQDRGMQVRIGEITFRNRNDFKFIAERDCGKTTRIGDGYADTYYQQRVFPDRQCPHCGLNEHGETAEQKEARYVAKREQSC